MSWAWQYLRERSSTSFPAMMGLFLRERVFLSFRFGITPVFTGVFFIDAAMLSFSSFSEQYSKKRLRIGSLRGQETSKISQQGSDTDQ
jgi:hypothetical protein